MSITSRALIPLSLIVTLLACATAAVAQDQAIGPAASTPTVTLAAATAAALAHNPTALAAQQQYFQARARVDQASALLHSQITYSGSVGVSNADVLQPPPSHETFGTFLNTVNLPLPLGKKPRLAVTQSTLQLQAAQASWDGARLALSAQVSNAYYDMLRKEALLTVARETLANASRQLEDARKRFRAGDVPELDVLRAQVPVSSAEAGAFQTEMDVVVAKQAMNAMIGQPLDSLFEVEAPADNNPDPRAVKISIDEARTTALKNNPDVRSAEALEMAADAGLKIARLSREPTYALQVSDSRSNDQTSFSRIDALQATITIPLSDGGLAKAQLREATAAREQARLQTESARRAATVAVSTAYLNLKTSAHMIEAARTTTQIAQTTYDKTRAGYAAGLFPLTDVLNAQSALAQSKVGLTQATYDAAVARTALNTALGILP